VHEARHLIRGLRPTVLDDFGLARALLVEVEALQSEGWDIGVDERLGSGRLPPTIETALYRVVQESLTNIRQHAGKGRVQVSLRRHGQTVRLVVRDWGRGFTVRPRERQDPARGAHIGLEAMEERISLLSGQFAIHSRPGRGTTIEVTVPVQQPWTVGGKRSA
jgi:signal transduction histidine kinase